jgi:hypothetical protein
MRAIRLLGFLPLLFLGSCCCDEDDDCWWTVDCYWSACCYNCYDVQHCSGYQYGMVAAPEDLDFEATAWEAGDGRIDIIVRVTGTRADGTTPLSVRLMGPEMADLRRESPKTVWGFYGIPISAAERIEVSVPGSEDRVERELPGADLRASVTCDPRDRFLGKTILAPVPAAVALGTDLALSAPRAEDVLAEGTSIGLEVEVFRPDDVAPRQLFLREGEASSIRLDQAGRWTFRFTLLTDDVCEGPSADSVVVEETEIEVR